MYFNIQSTSSFFRQEVDPRLRIFGFICALQTTPWRLSCVYTGERRHRSDSRSHQVLAIIHLSKRPAFLPPPQPRSARVDGTEDAPLAPKPHGDALSKGTPDTCRGLRQLRSQILLQRRGITANRKDDESPGREPLKLF